MRPRRHGRPTPRSGLRRAMWWAAGAGAGLLVVLGTAVAIRLASVASDLHTARNLINTASSDIEQGRLAPARSELAAAQTVLVRANSRLYNAPELDTIGWLPGVKQNLSSLRASVGVALQLVGGGNNLLTLTQPLENQRGHLEVPLRNGTIPLNVVQQARVQAQQLAGLLPGPGEQPSTSLLLGPVADLQRTIYQQAERRRTQVDNVGRALLLLSDMAGGQGDRRYLIAVANPAEMRGAGGMVLSYGTLQSSRGTFTLGDFGSIDDLFLDTGVDPSTLGLPSDLLQRWGALEPTRLWRNTTVNPNFVLDAPILEAMYTKKTGLAVDGVIQVDPAGLAAILVGTGPVDVPTLGSVSSDNVVDLTLNRAYIDFPNRDQRQELLADVAKATFKKLTGGQLDSLRPLGEAVARAASGGHISFFANSASAEEQSAFFNAAGRLPAAATQDYALLTVQNFSKNKLDYYLDTSVSLSGDRFETQVGHVTATVTIANNAPADGTASYVFGPNAPGEEAGLYRGTVSLYLPDGTALVTTTGDPTETQPTVVADGGRTAVTFDVKLRPGEHRTVTLQLTLVPRPKGRYQLSLVPIGRVRATTYAVDLDLGHDQRARRSMTGLVSPEAVGATPSH